MHDPRHVEARRRVWSALILVLATDHLALGITSVGQTRALAISGAALLTAAALSVTTARKPGVTVTLAVLGTTPLAVTTWWSIVTPILATVTVAVALAAIRPPAGYRPPPRQPGTDPSAIPDPVAAAGGAPSPDAVSDRLEGGAGSDRVTGDRAASTDDADHCDGGPGTDSASTCETITGIP